MTPTAIGSSTAAHREVDAASVRSPTPEQQKAARDFEAIFLRQLMSSLEKSGGLGGQSSGGQVFRSMMVSALADTASDGGGIGLSELILKAMLPPSPQARPDLSSHGVPSSRAQSAAASPSSGERSDATDDPSSGIRDRAVSSGVTSSGVTSSAVKSSRWGAPSRVLTEARPARMLEERGTALGGVAREGSSR